MSLFWKNTRLRYVVRIRALNLLESRKTESQRVDKKIKNEEEFIMKWGTESVEEQSEKKIEEWIWIADDSTPHT